MKTFSPEVRELAVKMNHGYCCVDGCYNRGVEHHHKLHNTLINNKLYPLFIQSLFNDALTCRRHHENYTKYKELNITLQIAKVFEEYLRLIKGVK